MTVTSTIPQTTPRSLEVLIEHVRAEIECQWCSAVPGRSCDHQGRRSVHLSRFIHALVRRQVTIDEIAVVIRPYPEGNFRAATIIRGDRPAVPAAEQPGPDLYVVWEIDDRDPEDPRRTVVTDPKPLTDAERFAEREARFFAGRLEVAPARPEDLADAEGEPQ
jgi:hypothetical protein